MKEVKCNLCGCGFYRVVFDLKRHGKIPPQVEYRITGDKADLVSLRIARCLKCGLIYASPQANTAEILEKYRAMKDELYLSEEKGRRLAAGILLKKISRFKKKGRLLDVGCAAGFFLDEAKKSGWQAQGVELSGWAAEYARNNFALEIFEGQLGEAHLPNGYFDAVVMMDAIEHLADPAGTIEEARRILKPGGILCVSTPDIDSFLSRLLGARWWGIQQSHLYYFSGKTLGRMLDCYGFRVIKSSSHARVFSLNYWNKRLEGYNKGLHKFFCFVSELPFLRNMLIRVNFRDQIELFAQKKRSLEHIMEDEKAGGMAAEGRKMKTVAVLPAYNAAKTLSVTVRDIPKDAVEEIILVDDKSCDNTVGEAGRLGLKVFAHSKNKGYGANQKTCYAKALEAGAEIVVMVHPDYQYDPAVIPKLIEPIQKGEADAVFGSRMLNGGALEGGMPLWKYNANILLTAFENVVLGAYLSEFHSGFRAYSAKYLKSVNFTLNSDGFVFDTEIIVQGLIKRMRIEEIPIRTRYFEEASTIKFLPSVIYGLGILKALFKYLLHKNGILRFAQFE